MVERMGQISRSTRPAQTQGAPAKTGQSGVAFRDVFTNAMRSELKVSAHAQTRLQSGRIALSQEAMDRLSDAVERAAEKGARESLILMDNIAFVVSVKNRTVITAVSPDRVKENVFTNIDSAVIT